MTNGVGWAHLGGGGKRLKTHLNEKYFDTFGFFLCHFNSVVS